MGTGEGSIGSLRVLSHVFLALAPGLFWLWYFRRKDDLEPEPRHILIRAFLIGGAAGFLALTFRPHLEAMFPISGTWSGLVIDAYGMTALVEEALKLLVLFGVAYLHPEFDEPLDGIVYGVAVALGFATIENLIYLEATGNPAIILQRAFTSVLAHVSFTGALGYFLGIAKFSGRGRKWYCAVGGFSLAVFLHGTYDVFLLSGGRQAYLSLVVILPLSLVLFGLKLRWHRARSEAYHPRPSD